VTNTPLIWAEIDLDAVAANTRELRRVTRPEARLLVAVKANAYGHGLVEVARQALAVGADTLGVARMLEALALRDAGVDAPILVFGYTPPSDVEALLRHDLIQTVYALGTARAYSERIGKSGGRLKVHLKVDTGMGRLGILPDTRRYVEPGMAVSHHAIGEVLAIAGLKELKLEGIFTHFASSDSADKSFSVTTVRQVFGHFSANWGAPVSSSRYDTPPTAAPSSTCPTRTWTWSGPACPSTGSTLPMRSTRAASFSHPS